jgi:hypothetical protein
MITELMNQAAYSAWAQVSLNKARISIIVASIAKRVWINFMFNRIENLPHHLLTV